MLSNEIPHSVIKYCNKEFNPLNGCTTIKIGTLQEYRENYHDQAGLINDGEEGSGILYDSNYNTYIGVPVQNCYVLSTCYQEVKPEIIKEYFGDYDSSYVISNVREFASKIGNLLLSYIQLQDLIFFDEYLPNELTIKDLNQLSIIADFKKVTYVEQKVFVQELKEEGPDLYKKYVFCKPKKYEPQNEFRFIFMVHHPHYGIISVKKDSKILDLRVTGNNILPRHPEPIRYQYNTIRGNAKPSVDPADLED